MSSGQISIELVYVDLSNQAQNQPVLQEIQCRENSSISEVIQQSGLLDQYQLDLDSLSVGIWHQVVKDLSILVQDKDRIEVYQPLKIDPTLAELRR